MDQPTHYIELDYNLSVPMEDHEVKARALALELELAWLDPTGPGGHPFGALRLEGLEVNLRSWLILSGYCDSYGKICPHMFEDTVGMIEAL